MALMLGLDTGGTYTDAVLYDDAAPHPGILAKAKALTTRHDLSIGLGGAIDAVLSHPVAPKDCAAIALVSVSTTLATNALVEGQGGRVCLVMIGFGRDALDRAGLGQALGNDPVVFAAGGLSASGVRQAPLDRAAITAAAAEYGDAVDAFAVIAHFGTRDTSDEVSARDLIVQATGKPVTCGHELAQALGGPKRALTALLNARLIGLIADLIAATEAILASRGIMAPFMLVRGDGALVSADFAKSRPIETILSGPAASLVGAAHLTDTPEAIVSDIGGTTTDIAVLSGGRPALSPSGATVGTHNTMVEAVAVTTYGLGGDSAVRVDETSMAARLILGPRRLIPLSLLAVDHGAIVHAHLDDALSRPRPAEHDGQFLLRKDHTCQTPALRSQDNALLDRLGQAPVPTGAVVRNRMDLAALGRLVGSGMVLLAGMTPSDAAHVLENHVVWDKEAALKGAALMASRRTAAGTAVAPDALAFARMIQNTLRQRSAEVLLDAALEHDGLGLGSPSMTPLAQRALGGHRGAAKIDIGLAWPLIGLGASAALHYPGVAAKLGTEAMVPEHADVANAIGAVVGQVRVTERILVTQPSDGKFRIHTVTGNQECTDLQASKDRAQRLAQDAAQAAALDAGATDVDVTVIWDAKTATIEGRDVFVEGWATASAMGRPRLARS